MGAAQRVWASLLGLLLAGGGAFVLYGFTVDDALISARYASNIASGLGHRFNPGGLVTDGVTPLPWPYLLAPFATTGPLAALRAGMWMGILVWVGAAGALSLHLSRILGRHLCPGHLAFLVAFGTPAVAAWAVSGMETGVALGLVTFAVVLATGEKRRWVSSALVGVACTLRPELLPFALTLAFGSAWQEAPHRDGDPTQLPVRVRALLRHMGPALLPFLIVTATRWWVFGEAGPLALRAKPSDLSHGFVYASATWVVAGPPLAVFAPWAWRKLPGSARWLLAAFVVHTATCLGVGGDWMPMSRLFVPVLPALAVVFAHLAKVTSGWCTLARALLCLAGQFFVLWNVGLGGARVLDDRSRLIESLEGRVARGDVVASLDIGWVGAAHNGRVFDLAGVTDPDIAALPGGHTSKRVPPEFLEARGVSHIVLLLPQHPGVSSESAWERCEFSRAVETRICQMQNVRDGFVVDGQVRSTDRLAYVLLRRVSDR